MCVTMQNHFAICVRLWNTLCDSLSPVENATCYRVVQNLPIETEDITVREMLLRHEYADVGRGMSRCVESMWVPVSVGVREKWARPEMSDIRKS
jgi:hypothetical protein